MKKLLFLAFFFTSFLVAQNAPNLLFVNKENNIGYGGTIYTTNSTKDTSGNTYLIGSFTNMADFDPSVAEANMNSINEDTGDMFIAKYDSNGNYLWSKNIGGSGSVSPTGIVIGGSFIYIVGNFKGNIDFDPSINVFGLTTSNINDGAGFIAKYDLNGFFVTCKSIDGSDWITINDIKFLNNQVFIAGTITGTMDFDPSINTLELTSNGLTDAFVAKYNTSILVQTAISFGGSGNDYLSSLALDTSGNILISGSYNGTVDFDPSAAATTLTTSVSTSSYTYIAKYSNNGIFQWVKDIGGRVSNGAPSSSKLVLDSSNNILITGSYNQSSDFDPSASIANMSSAGSSDIFMAKYDANGNYIWAKKMGSSGADYSNNITIDASNNINIFGIFYSAIVDFDPDGGVYNLDSLNGKNYFAKYDSNGLLIYANNLNTTISTMHVDSNNNLILSGYFSGTIDFDPSGVTANLNSLRSNVFLAKYSTNGSYVFSEPIGGDKPSNSVVNFIASDGVGNLYRVGSLSATTDLDPSAAVFNVSSLTVPGIFIAKYTSDGSFLWAKSIFGGTSLTVSGMNTDANGNTYFVGRFKGTVDFDPSGNIANLTANNGALNDVYVAKYDSNGNYLWAKQIIGNLSVRGNIAFDTFGNFYFSGGFSGVDPVDFDPSPSNAFYLTSTGQVDPYIVKFDSQGNFLLAKSFEGLNTTNNWAEISKLVLKGDYLYVTGRLMGTVDFNPSPTVVNNLTTSVAITNETFFAKYNLNIDYEFAFKFNNNDGCINKGSSIVIDDNNEIYVTTDIASTGNVDFDPSPVNDFLISPSATGDSLVISKYNQNGIFLWAKKIDGLSEYTIVDINFIQNVPLSFSSINDNNLIIAFSTWSSIDFDPSVNEFIISPSIDNHNYNQRNIVMAKYNTTNGDFIWANKIDGNYSGQLHSFEYKNQNLLISGMFAGTADFDFSSAVQNSTSVSPFNNDRFWAKYDSISLGIEDNIHTNEFVIYPNPTNSMLYVSNNTLSEFNVIIMDITGKIIQKGTLTNLKGVDVSSYPQGMYFIQIENQNEKKTYKFIKE